MYYKDLHIILLYYPRYPTCVHKIQKNSIIRYALKPLSVHYNSDLDILKSELYILLTVTMYYC